MRGRALIIGDKHYQLLSEMLKGKRQRALVVEELIEILAQDFQKDKYIMFDLMTGPSSLTLNRKKKIIGHGHPGR